MLRRVFSFPDQVNEVAARLVALGVVLMSISVLAGARWVLPFLAAGFVARVASGPTLSPLGQLVTRVIAPALPIEPRPTPGTPKRFAQGIGATLSVAAVVAMFGFHNNATAMVLVAMIAVAASLEAFVGFCLGCAIFGQLMRIGVIPESACEECADISLRLGVHPEDVAARVPAGR